MIWAILKLYCELGRRSNLREFMKQRMIVVQLVTFLVYLVSLLIYYGFYAKWDVEDNKI